MDSFMTTIMDLTEPQVFCKTDNSTRISSQGNSESYIGYYAFAFTSKDADRLKDPRLDLSNNQIPALILRGKYDYLNWKDAYGYKQNLPNAKLLYFKNSGHLLYEERHLYLASVRAFLLDRSLPLPPYRSNTPPQ